MYEKLIKKLEITDAMKKLPAARSKNVIVQSLDKETLIYDLNADKAFCLNETSSAIYRACDGSTSFDELKRSNKFSDEIILLALDELERENLLEREEGFTSSLSRISRREMIRRAGYASAVALPLVMSLSAPKSVDAQSGACGGACTCSLVAPNVTTGTLCSSIVDLTTIPPTTGTSTCVAGAAGVACDCIVTASTRNGVCIGV